MEGYTISGHRPKRTAQGKAPKWVSDVCKLQEACLVHCLGPISPSSSLCHSFATQMGKKNKAESPNPSNITNRDILQRLNFLYQASVYLESISRKCGESVDTRACPSAGESEPPMDATAVAEAGPSTATLSKAAKRKRDREQCKGRVIQAADIGQGYVRAMRLIGQKTTVKMLVLFGYGLMCCLTPAPSGILP